mgnify:CR=1 FL=1
MSRRPDWPGRLAALLAAAEARPFDARRWNCALFALATVEAVTGQRPAFRVRPDLAASADSAGFPRAAPLLARSRPETSAARSRATKSGRRRPLAAAPCITETCNLQEAVWSPDRNPCER